jgi:hypothetical protein
MRTVLGCIKEDKMKLTEQKLRQMIRETIQEFSEQRPGYSSKEAKSIVATNVKQSSKLFKQLKHKLIKGWMDLAKSGHVDFFDIMRGVATGDARRASSNEINFMKSMLSQDNVQDAFRRYFKGKKSLPTRKWK